MRDQTRVRGSALTVLLVVVVLFATGMVGGSQQDTTGTDFGDREDVLFVTTQGTTTLQGQKSAAKAIDTETGTTLWEHGSYERYFDIEPLSDREVLFLGADGPHGANMWVNVVDWRTGERTQRFRVPDDTHDVDVIDDHRYAVADKEHHRLYVYNATSGETAWEYVYADHYPESAGGTDDYTHVNDVDVVANGSLLLTSPRNFDRVTLVNTTTDELVWTLGAEDDYSVLHEQHNPTLLSRDPPTVLVADSENDRVVEYRLTDDEWTKVWAYRGTLSWPRDADRLPNGNTLIVDSGGQRVLEVTPGREVVWEMSLGKNPYDADFLSTGEEPRGPSMAAFRDGFDGPDAVTSRHASLLSQVDSAVALLQWVIPWTVGVSDLALLTAAGAIGVFWTGFELSLLTRRRRVKIADRLPTETGLFTVAGLAVAAVLLVAPGVDRYAVPVTRGFGVFLVGSGLVATPDRWLDHGPLSRVDELLGGQTAAGVAALSTFVCVGLAVLTVLNAFYLAVGAYFAVTAFRVFDPAGSDDAIVRLARVGGYLVRAGAFVPVLALVYVSQKSPLTAVYLGLALVVLGAVAVPHGCARSIGDRRSATTRAVFVGLRAIVVTMSVVALAGLVYTATQPTTLGLAYAGLFLALASQVALLVRT